MKKLILILLLAFAGINTQAQCARCKHPKVYIERSTGIQYPCKHWYKAVNRSTRHIRHRHSRRRILFIHI